MKSLRISPVRVISGWKAAVTISTGIGRKSLSQRPVSWQDVRQPSRRISGLPPHPMSETTDWAFPSHLRPSIDTASFDLAAALDSMVLLHAEVPEDAFTATVLGTERLGNGIVIGSDGLVLTIGYLITEAQSIWLTTNDNRAIQGYPLAYDQCTGFGLVMPLGRLDLKPLSRGSASRTPVGARTIIMGHGGLPHSVNAQLVAKREFAGYWEYVLDEALFAAPAHPQWGGTALLDESGQLIGIGSLLVQEEVDGEVMASNMFVPIDLLEPILDDMLRFGRPRGPARPWLGLYATEANGRLVVGGLAEGGPAQRAGVRPGDAVLEVAGQRVSSLAQLFRQIWSVGPAGSEIPLTLVRGAATSQVRVHSGDRNEFLKKPVHH